MESAAAVLERTPSVEALYRADADRLWRAVFAFAADAEIASDAVAEAYAQVLNRGPAVRDPQAWTWRAAFRIASGALKARRDASALPTLPTDVSDRYADLPVSRIAERLGSNSLAVRANLSRGRRRLRELLGDDDA